MKTIILASKSPRRIDILHKFTSNFQVIPAQVDEKIHGLIKPQELVMAIAFKKANEVANRVKGQSGIVMGADTIVYQNEIIGKPNNRMEAFNILEKLSGKTHEVYTGFALIDLNQDFRLVDYEMTEVTFKSLTEKTIQHYLDTEEYIDKAGAYGIQGFGELLIEKINGSYGNVMGLPISKIDSYLKSYFNIDLLTSERRHHGGPQIYNQNHSD